jgi:alpha-beta hydrolase superfamily lysophospholipase
MSFGKAQDRVGYLIGCLKVKRIFFVVLFVILVLALGCTKERQSADERQYVPADSDAAADSQQSKTASKYSAPASGAGGMETVDITADDNIDLVASYYPGNEKLVILMHAMNRNRHDWDSFAKRLDTMGFTVISFDLRGHGDSGLNWMDFEDADYRKMVGDVGAVADYVYTNNDVKIARAYVVGSSIGANLAVMYGVTDSKVRRVVMLSPGNNYHGLNPLDALLKFSKPAMIVFSKRDNNAADAYGMKEIGKGERKMVAYDNSRAHGNEMFAEHPELTQDIIDFINE